MDQDYTAVHLSWARLRHPQTAAERARAELFGTTLEQILQIEKRSVEDARQLAIATSCRYWEQGFRDGAVAMDQYALFLQRSVIKH